MQKTRKLHLADFVKLAERFASRDKEAPEPPRVRIRQPDEEIRVAPWTGAHPYFPGWSYTQHNRGIS